MPRVTRSKEEQALVNEHGPDFLEVLARSLRVMEAFGERGAAMSLAEIVTASGVPRGSARRIVYTLERLGYAQSTGKRFSLTPGILRLATAYLSASLAVKLQPAMDRLSAELGESCSAAVLDGDEIVFIARASPVRVLSVDLSVGYRLPAWCTALGRVLLAELDDAGLIAALERVDRTAFTTYTVTEINALVTLIRAVREQGYALVDQEAELGLRSIAVPVRRHDGKAVAAIHVGVHVERITRQGMTANLLPALRAAADELSHLVV